MSEYSSIKFSKHIYEKFFKPFNENSVEVKPNASGTIIVKTPNIEVDILEAEDTLFRLNSSFFLPSKIDDNQKENEYLEDQKSVSGLSVLSTIFQYYDRCLQNGVKKKLLITGHTDSVGSEDDNEVLSQKRANVILHLMLGDKENRDKYIEIVSNNHTVEDIQHFLTWASERFLCSEFDPGPIDGVIGKKTEAAITEFKTEFNDSLTIDQYEDVVFSDDIDDIKSSLTPEPEFDENMWAAVFELYQAEIQVALEEKNLDLINLRSKLEWVDSEKKSVGCGETWPLESRGKDNFSSQTNRRVEILCYDHDEMDCDIPCKDGVCDAKDCHIFKNIDRYKPEKEFLATSLTWEYLSLENPSGEYSFKIRLSHFIDKDLLTGKEYILDWDKKTSDTKEKLTDESLIETKIPGNVKKARIRVWVNEQDEKPSHTINFKIEKIRSIKTIKGLQQRLINLGFDAGPVDGKLGLRTKEAIFQFQYYAELEFTGEPDNGTLSKLQEAYGS